MESQSRGSRAAPPLEEAYHNLADFRSSPAYLLRFTVPCCHPRSYISAITEVITDPSLSCDGMAKDNMGEARLDILDSEVDRE